MAFKLIVAYPDTVDLDDRLEEAVSKAGTCIDGGRGSGFGMRDHDWLFENKVDADKALEACEEILREAFASEDDWKAFIHDDTEDDEEEEER